MKYGLPIGDDTTAKKYLPLPKNKMADLKKNTNNAPSSHCSSVQFRE